ncbi:hypothetical protein NW768_002749 [Fusarium equiseti]|uniref:Wax synthase domain-containing protein n=1 Tax=Fusarium equiseti TaxID=61235 RepID=A0ABQ8RK04_FUSEQ|nr:hypothetical protein NW768_002749 [Fusarium equiseti]
MESLSAVLGLRIWVIICIHLSIFSSTVVFTRRNAILPRLTAIAILCYLNYIFHLAILETSMTTTQKCAVCNMSWGFWISGAEQLLLSQFHAEDLIDKSEGRYVGKATLLWRGVKLYFNLRRVGVRGEVSMRRRQSQSRAQLLRSKTIELFFLYLILDIAMNAPLPEGHLISKEKETLFNLSNLSSEDIGFRFVGTLGYWVLSFVCNRFNNACAAIISLALGLSQPDEWPSLNGPISACCTIRGFWGTFWHQLYRRTLTGWGDFIPDKALGLRRGTLLSRYVRLTLAFLLSGLMHHPMVSVYSLGADDTWSCEKFFLLQAFGIMVEDAVQTMAEGLSLPRPMRRLAGYTWVVVFLVWSTPVWMFPPMRQGDSGQMVPFSFVGLLK